MSVRRLAEVQPASFAFTPENAEWCKGQIAKYPEGRQASAVIPLLWQAQKQNDYWLPKLAIEKVADMLGMPNIRVLEIATFYTMFNLAPVGKHYIQFCGTTPCVLRGADDIKAVLQRRIGPQQTVTADGTFSWLEVECLGACCNAPMVQINDDYYEDLTAENFDRLLDDLAAGRPVKVGSQIGRVCSEPEGGLTTLTTFYGVDGRSGPQTAGATPSASDHGAARTEHAAQAEPPGDSATARLEQEQRHSTAAPESKTVDTGTDRTGVAVSKGDKKANRAAAERASSSSLHGGAPSHPPGIEPADEKK